MIAAPKNAPPASVSVRPIRESDAAAWLALRDALWPGDQAGHASEIAEFFAGRSREPAAVLLAERSGAVVGLVELSLRAYAEGCTSSPVGYVEGWYVVPQARRSGVGKALIAAAESWARDRGCTELASDTELDNSPSARAHAALGFEEVVMIRCFKKAL